VVVAETAWRQHGNPVANISIPLDTALIDKKYEEIAREHGTYIHTLGEHRGNEPNVKFGIWGAPANAEKAGDDISIWLKKRINHSQPAHISKRASHKATDMFPKIHPVTPKQREEAARKWRADVELEKFRQHPPYDMAHDSIGHFHWPEDGDFRPDEVLGRSYEALDPIRKACRCYIVWIPDASAFRVMGEIEQVKRVLHRIRLAYFQIVAQSIGPVQLHVLRVPEGTCLPFLIAREPYCDPLGSTTFGNVDSHSLLAPMTKSQKCLEPQQQSLRKQAEIQALHVKHIITHALKQFHYFRGRLELRFRLGRLSLERALEPQAGDAYTLDEYLKLTEAPLFKARVTDK
jgi:hypothetical protein